MKLFCLMQIATLFNLKWLLFHKKTRYSWTTPVRDILGEDYYLTNGYLTNNTLLTDLVAHRTGYASHFFIFAFDAMNREELIK